MLKNFERNKIESNRQSAKEGLKVLCFEFLMIHSNEFYTFKTLGSRIINTVTSTESPPYGLVSTAISSICTQSCFIYNPSPFLDASMYTFLCSLSACSKTGSRSIVPRPLRWYSGLTARRLVTVLLSANPTLIT
jgi:hypothetical protein